METLGAGSSGGSCGACGGETAGALDDAETPLLISPATAAAGPPDEDIRVERGDGAEVGKGITTAGSSESRSARLDSDGVGR